MQHLNPHKFAAGGAIAAGLVYLLIAALVLVLPDRILPLISAVHFAPADSRMMYELTAVGIITGLVAMLIYSYIAVWLWATIYNALLNRK